MTTPARPQLIPTYPATDKDGICPFCFRLFTYPRTGRKKVYCCQDCQQAAWLFDRLGQRLRTINEYATTEGKSQIRADLWSMANGMHVNKGKGTHTFKGRKERKGSTS